MLINTVENGKLRLQKRGNTPERLCRAQAGQLDSELEGGAAVPQQVVGGFIGFGRLGC